MARGYGYADRNLGPAYAVRLGDLRQYHRLLARCHECRHQAWLDPVWVRHRRIRHISRLGGWGLDDDAMMARVNEIRLIDLTPALRCTICNNRRHNSWEPRIPPRND